MAPTLTRQQAMAIQDALITIYSQADFQAKLRAALREAGEDAMKKIKARQETCLPIQGPIISMYGFEASRKGVALSIAAFAPYNNDPEIAARNATLAALVNPDVRSERDSKVEADEASKAKRQAAAATEPAAAAEEPGRHWKVVGGHSHGGIVVRRGKELSSDALSRLSTGAEVEQLELSGERLHYRRISGEGPDFGWVSISLKGAPLLEPIGAQ